MVHGRTTDQRSGRPTDWHALGDHSRSFVRWYLAPVLDWLATNWPALLHQERTPWRRTGAPTALECRQAFDQWIAATDDYGQRRLASVQRWYRKHGLRSAAAGGIFPDLFIRRFADDVELSWSAEPPPFTPDGLTFETGAGLPVSPSTRWRSLFRRCSTGQPRTFLPWQRRKTTSTSHDCGRKSRVRKRRPIWLAHISDQPSSPRSRTLLAQPAGWTCSSPPRRPNVASRTSPSFLPQLPCSAGWHPVSDSQTLPDCATP